jgi:hypothetical protein
MTTVALPQRERVGEQAAQIVRAMQAHPGYERMRSSSMRYSTCWAMFTGYPLIGKWSLERVGLSRAKHVRWGRPSRWRVRTVGPNRLAFVADAIESPVAVLLLRLGAASRTIGAAGGQTLTHGDGHPTAVRTDSGRHGTELITRIGSSSCQVRPGSFGQPHWQEVGAVGNAASRTGGGVGDQDECG